MEEPRAETGDAQKVRPYAVWWILLLAIASVILIHYLSGISRERFYTIRTVDVHVDSLQQIEMVSDSLIKPVLYSGVHGLNELERSKAKDLFVSVILPAILVAKHNVLSDSLKIAKLLTKREWTPADSSFYLEKKAELRAEGPEDLCLRLISLPNSIVLAQAAIETGWGQSRFFLEGNNVFGIWSFNPEEPRLQAGVSRQSPVYVKAYNNISESISDYFETLGSVKAYSDLRKARASTNDPFELITHLKYYSERRSWYTRQLRTMIEQNDFTRYDHYQLDPLYYIPE